MDVAKVLPDIIRLTEEAARANTEASQALRKVLAGVRGGWRDVQARNVEPGMLIWDFVDSRWLTVERANPDRGDVLIATRTGKLYRATPEHEFRVANSSERCPSVCEGDTHRWPCAEAERIAESEEWSRGA